MAQTIQTATSARATLPTSAPSVASRCKFSFVFLWSCGYVLAERALKEVKKNLCHMCQQPFVDNDVVVLNGTDENVEKLREKMSVRVASRKSGKKSKADKIGKVEIKVEPATFVASTSAEIATESSIKEEIETIPLYLPKFNPNKQARRHFGSSKRVHPTELAQDPSYKKTKKDYSVSKDPETSEVYKSLFTSHATDKDQKRAHWVTYNPFYN